MLQILDDRTERFIKFLNMRYPCEADIRLMVLPGYDAVTSDASGVDGFAAFLPEQNVIMLPTDVPSAIVEEGDAELTRDFVIHNLAHEYAHALQFNGQRKVAEDKLEEDADAFTDEAVRSFIYNNVANCIAGSDSSIKKFLKCIEDGGSLHGVRAGDLIEIGGANILTSYVIMLYPRGESDEAFFFVNVFYPCMGLNAFSFYTCRRAKVRVLAHIEEWAPKFELDVGAALFYYLEREKKKSSQVNESTDEK